MNLQCIACHTEFPLLNDLGRQFKLSGYTMSADQTILPPIAVMLQPSFTHTQAGQAGGAASGFKDNNNYAMSQVSIFYAGRLFGPYPSKLLGADAAAFLNKFGVFNQTTYNGVSKTWSWDNTEFRFADIGTFAGHGASYGVYMNNNPTLQDPWNGTPAFGYPFSSSKLAPVPGAAALIDGKLSGQVAGLGAYAMVDGSYYFDVGAYRTIGSKYQRALGVSPAGEAQIANLAPYWRFAYTRPVSDATWEVGVFGLGARTYPGRDRSAGRDKTVDFGVDSQYQKSFERSDLTALVTGICEKDTWTASQQLGNTSNVKDSLRELRVTVDYLFDKTYGCAVQHFSVRGSDDALAYGSSQTGSPNSDGFIFQANYLPFNKVGGPAFWPRSNVKFSVQYVCYNRFDGSTTNIDGAGRNARDNNTLYFEAWILF